MALSTKYGVTDIEYGGIIVSPFYQNQQRKTDRLRKQAKKFDARLEAARQEWVFIPPSNMTIFLQRDAGTIPAGLVLSVPHVVGRMLLHKRLGRIIEHEVTVDAVIDAGIEDACSAMELGTVDAAGVCR